MPIARLPNGKLLYFAHVPKAAGTSVEHYLRNRFGLLALHDGRFSMRDPNDAWSLSPPQHMPESVRQRLLPDALFDGIFATVRHPVTRLRSAFLFQREVEQNLPPSLEFSDWLKSVPEMLANEPYALHGHLRPMIETVPETAVVFRIEEGLHPIVDWLDDKAEDKREPREIGMVNVLAKRVKSDVPDIPLTPRIIQQITEMYAADFERFNYPENPSTLSSPEPTA